MDMEPKGEIAESIARNPGYCDTPDIDYTKGYSLQQTVSSLGFFALLIR